MSLKINLNTAAQTANRLLSVNDSKLSKSIERLSSGYRINSAADDPAGLVISEKLRAQVGGLEQAIANAGDAVNMVKTAEGALVEVNNLLSSIRDLAVHAANAGANDSAAVAADQAQIDSAIASINKIAEETQFGNKKLLDGSAGIKTTVTGLAVTGANLNYATTLDSTDSVSVTVTQAAQQATFQSKDFGGDDTATVGAAGTFQLTGNGTTVNIDYTAATTVTQLAAAINAKTSDTGIVASIDGSGQITFTSQKYGSDAAISITNGGDVLTGGALTDAAIGIDAQATVTHTGGTGGDVSDATWASGNGTAIKDSLGNTINLTIAAATGAVPTTYTNQLTVEKGSLVFQVGAYAGQTREINIQSCITGGLGLGASTTMLSVSDLNVLTPDDAQEAINVLDKAISDVSTLRANLGATQTNVLESTINSLSIAKENISASESTIRDTDMASEITEMTKYQILEQAGVSMLAQANQMPQTLLKLLQ